jgi:hypothetical protein
LDHLPVYCSNAVDESFVEIGIAIGIGIEIEMVLGHEKLDVYRRGYSVKEGLGEYGYTEFDTDPDSDSDFEKI